MLAEQVVVQKDQHVGGELAEFPTRKVQAGIFLMLLLLCVATYLTVEIGFGIKRGTQGQGRVLIAAEQLERVGENLEVSARDAVASHDAAAASRNKLLQPRARNAINTLQELLQLPENRATAKQVERAEHELLAMQEQAIGLANLGHLDEARAILASKRYRQVLTIFKSGIHVIKARAKSYAQALDERLDWLLRLNLILTIAAFGLVITGWLCILRPARLWGERAKNSRDNALCLAEQLERRETELQELTRKFFEEARTDDLTKLQSRRRFEEDADRLWPLIERYGRSYCLLLCDVDEFGHYNACYGRPTGDAVLRRVADAMVGASREGDQIYWLSGDAFVVVIPDCKMADALVAAERFRGAVHRVGIEHVESEQGVVTVTIGVAELSQVNRMSVSDWAGRADRALRMAKCNGRNSVGGETLLRHAEPPSRML